MGSFAAGGSFVRCWDFLVEKFGRCFRNYANRATKKGLSPSPRILMQIRIILTHTIIHTLTLIHPYNRRYVTDVTVLEVGLLIHYSMG